MDRIENHLNSNPWLRGIYDEARAIAALDPGAALGDGLSEEDLEKRAEVMRWGDYDYRHDGNNELINKEAASVPEAYFAFLFLVGGFSCRSVNLFHLGKEYMYNDEGRGYRIPNVLGPSVRESVTVGDTRVNHVTFGKSYPVTITLGNCDHGEYVYDRRRGGYSLEGYGRVTPFNNCADMLSHAMYRARENIKDKWPDGGRDGALVGSWLLSGMRSYTFQPDGVLISVSKMGPSYYTWSTEKGKVFMASDGQAAVSASYKIKGKGDAAKLTITKGSIPGFMDGTYSKVQKKE